MSKFPDPIKLPKSVNAERKRRSIDLKWAIITGISIRAFIVILEIIGVILFDSSALLMDALASVMDIVSTVILWMCIKLAERPPDSNHPFGHGRYEPLAGFQLGLLLIMVGLVMFVQQSLEFQHGKEQQINAFACVIAVVATVCLEACYQIVSRYAKRHRSAALAADALHYRIDALNSLFAVVALSLGLLVPAWSHAFDNIGAQIIAVMMVVTGYIAARENFHQLMDRKPDKKFFTLIRNAAMRVNGVRESEKLRIQSFGPDAHVDIDIEVDPQLSVEKAHAITQKVRAEIQKDWPAVRDVIVHVEPYYPNDHNHV